MAGSAEGLRTDPALGYVLIPGLMPEQVVKYDITETLFILLERF